jgi:hypothetical protein
VLQSRLREEVESAHAREETLEAALADNQVSDRPTCHTKRDALSARDMGAGRRWVVDRRW